MRAFWAAVAMVAFGGGALAAAVTVDHGRIVVNGKAITQGGHDFDPVLSPDGKRVAFLRFTGGKPLEDCDYEATTTKAQELWSINADGSGARNLLTLKSNPDVQKALCAFDSLQFSSNGQLLYFYTPAWATSGAVHVYEFKTGTEHFFAAGNGLRVLTTCTDKPYRDDIVLEQHRYFVFGGSFDWLWLFSPAGKEIGPVGENDAMLKDACGN